MIESNYLLSLIRRMHYHCANRAIYYRVFRPVTIRFQRLHRPLCYHYTTKDTMPQTRFERATISTSTIRSSSWATKAQCAKWELNPYEKLGRLLCCHYIINACYHRWYLHSRIWTDNVSGYSRMFCQIELYAVMDPTEGFEPPTCRLQSGDTAVVLRRNYGIYNYT